MKEVDEVEVEINNQRGMLRKSDEFEWFNRS